MSKVLVATFNAKKLKLEAALKENGYPKSVLVRMGGVMDYPDYKVQINSIQGTLNCIDKLRSKEILRGAGLPTLDFFDKPIDFPFVMKGRNRSRGSSVFMVENMGEFEAYKKILRYGFYVEPYFSYTSEYRLHCTNKEVFFAVKKKKDEGRENDLFINADNHTNHRDFLKPRLWEDIKKASVKAVKQQGLEIACVDIGYSSEGNHKLVIHEHNNSPELRTNTFNAYVEALDNLIKEKL